MHSKRPSEWTTREASEHFEWFREIKDARINKITLFSDASNAGSLETKLGLITETVRRSLGNLATYTGDVQAVNGLGLIVGFDAALVVGDALVSNVDGASWKIMRTRIATLISRNLPVVQRHSPFAFEPFLEGRLALSLINREANAQPTNVLHSVYLNWCQKL